VAWAAEQKKVEVESQGGVRIVKQGGKIVSTQHPAQATPPGPATYHTITETETRKGKPWARKVQVNSRNPKDRIEGEWRPQEPRAIDPLAGLADEEGGDSSPPPGATGKHPETGAWVGKDTDGRPIIWNADAARWEYE
jgi:hypothetical protein